MNRKDMGPKLSRWAAACILSASLVAQVATPAIADTLDDLKQEEQEARDAAAAAEQQAQAAKDAQAALEKEVAAAQAQLEVLGQEAEAAEYDYITITTQLEETVAHIAELDEQIEQTRAELEQAKQELSDIVADTYKNGRPTLLSVALNATSFDDLVSRIQYANKVAEHETSVVNKVKDLEARLEQERAELEETKALQEQQQAEQAERLAAAEAAVAAVEDYQAQLSYEIQQKIAEADEALRRAAEESARADAAEAQRIAEEEARRRAEEEARRKAAEEAAAAAGASVSDVATAVGDVSSFVARAYSIIGSGYSWSGYNWTGSTASSWFTCSGVIDYALGRPPRASSPETLYAEVGGRMKYDVGSFEYGDLVFYACLGRSPGHVGIYVGNGKVLDSISSGGVAIRDVGYMAVMGGGSIF